MKFRNKKVLVTGGAGFLGSNLVGALLDLGADVTVIDREEAYWKNIEEFGDRILRVESDIAKSVSVDERRSSYDFVFHLAAYSSPALCEKEPDKAFRCNVQATYNILRFADKSKAKVIFPSAASLYGICPRYLPLDERHPVMIKDSVYNATKKICEDLCRVFHESHGLRYILFRIFNSYGPKQSPSFFIPSIIIQALREKEVKLIKEDVKRDFIYVSDVIAAFVKGASSEFCGGPINLGTGKATSLSSVVQYVTKKLNAVVTLINGEATGSKHMICDASLAKRILGWEAKVSVEAGLDKTIQWYRQHISWFKESS